MHPRGPPRNRTKGMHNLREKPKGRCLSYILKFPLFLDPVLGLGWKQHRRTERTLYGRSLYEKADRELSQPSEEFLRQTEAVVELLRFQHSKETDKEVEKQIKSPLPDPTCWIKDH